VEDDPKDGDRAAAAAERLEIVVLSGPSGSGKTAALHALEDVGFYCVDNLPSALLPSLVELAAKHPGTRRVALVIDVRERPFHSDLGQMLAAIAPAHDLEVVYLECDDVTLTNRFKTTRRPHPLVAQGVAATLAQALELERALLTPVRELAGARTIDTSAGTVHDLRRTFIERFGASEPVMALQLMSFGFHSGVPPEADFVFDVRYLDNPFFVEGLRELTGLDPSIVRYVMDQPRAATTLSHIVKLFDDVLPAIQLEGRAALTLAVGCTGGKHRSVVLVEALGRALSERGHTPSIRHRDIRR